MMLQTVGIVGMGLLGRGIAGCLVAGLRHCEFLIESVSEDLITKPNVLQQMEVVVGPTVPIATNTSSIPICVLQQGYRHPGRTIGMRWAAPCHVTNFLETNDATFGAL